MNMVKARTAGRQSQAQEQPEQPLYSSKSDADEDLSRHRSESTLLLVVIYVRFERASSAPFLVYESCSSGLDPAGVSVFSDLQLTKI